MNDKSKVWSESRGDYGDMTHGVGIFHGDTDVSTAIVKRGIVLLSDCSSCGRQTKSVMPWANVAMLYVGRPVQDAQPTRQGNVLCLIRCNGSSCGKQNTMVVDVSEISRWVEAGIQGQCLDPRIRQAKPR